MERIADRNNLHEAFLRAARGKACKRAVVEFRSHLDENLSAISRSLLDGTYQFGHYHFFTIYDPKKRVICAASFPERVVFHAMMRICHPVFDDYQVFDSYASRIGKGTYKALERAQTFSRRYRWFAKMDICKYFDSIHHDVLLQQLCRLFKDRQLLLYFQDLLATYEVSPSRGLPIGNLTSQYFANHYLAVADHYAKEQLHVEAYVRYMDDMLLFSDDKERLMSQVSTLTAWVAESLGLSSHPFILNKVCHGIPYLGYVVYGDGLRLNQRSRRRFAMKMSMLDERYWTGGMAEADIACRCTCLLAFADKAQDKWLKQKLYQEGWYS